jgi:hypothetical protein
MLAIGPEFFSFFAVQALGIGLVGAGFGNRLLVIAHFGWRRGLSRGSRSWGGRLRNGGPDTDYEKNNIALTTDFIPSSFSGLSGFVTPCP